MFGRGERRSGLDDGSGGDEEDRTPDLRIANATLSQLSYVPDTPNYNFSVANAA